MCSLNLPDCLDCSSDGMTCNTCNPGWTLLEDGTCFNSFCKIRDEFECLECEEGYHHVWDLTVENCYKPILSAY